MRPLLALLLAASCSWAFVRAPPSSTSLTVERPDCTTSRLAPAVDTTVSAGAAFATLVLNVVLPCEGDLCGLGQAMLFGAGALVVIPFGLSALHGWERVNRCHQLVEIYDNAHPPPAPPVIAPTPAAPTPAAPIRLPEQGEPCARPVEGVPNSGVCRRGLLCRARVCVAP